MASLPSRPYDALYDPTYTVSGARDHYKQQGSGGFLIEKVPEHSNLFSELQHYPTSVFRIASNDKVPAFIDRSFHPYQPQPGQLQQQSLAHQVNGRQQFKYFRRPHLPPGARLSVQMHLAVQKPMTPLPPAPPEPAIKDAATQSDYRENETQTLPWSPDWVLPSDPAVLAKQAVLCAKRTCAGPELLQLADLKIGDGLPGGLQEVRRLEKMREKRAFEATLPPIDDAERLPQRQAMIEAWEAAEWAEREEEIQGVQEERLALLETALKVREEEIEGAHRAQVEQRTAAILASKSAKFATIHASRIKTIRQLAARRRAVDVAAAGSQRQAGSIIDKYADYGSSVYAPLQREGRFSDTIKSNASVLTAANASQSVGVQAVQPHCAVVHAETLTPSTVAELQELQASLPSRALQPKLHKPKPPAKLSYSQRVDAAVQQDVETINSLLQSAKATQGRGVGQVWPYPVDEPGVDSLSSSAKKLGSRRIVGPAAAVAGRSNASGAVGANAALVSSRAAGNAKPGERPFTPEAPPLPDADGQHAALVLLQRLLRGRAVQNEMYAGKTAQLQLVRELRLGLEGTAGHQARPEACDAASQELDAAIGAAVCHVCCLLASDDEAAITALLLSVARQKTQQHDEDQLDPQWIVNASDELVISQQQGQVGEGVHVGQQQMQAAQDARQEKKQQEQVEQADAGHQQQDVKLQEAEPQQCASGDCQEQQQPPQQQQECAGQEEAQQVQMSQAQQHSFVGDVEANLEDDQSASRVVTAAAGIPAGPTAVLEAVAEECSSSSSSPPQVAEDKQPMPIGDCITKAVSQECSEAAAPEVCNDTNIGNRSSSSGTAAPAAPAPKQAAADATLACSQAVPQTQQEVQEQESAAADGTLDKTAVTAEQQGSEAAAAVGVAPEALQHHFSLESVALGEASLAGDTVASEGTVGRAAEASLAGGVLLSGAAVAIEAGVEVSCESTSVGPVGSLLLSLGGSHQEPDSEGSAAHMLRPTGKVMHDADLQQENSSSSSSSSSSSGSSEGDA